MLVFALARVFLIVCGINVKSLLGFQPKYVALLLLYTHGELA